MIGVMGMLFWLAMGAIFLMWDWQRRGMPMAKSACLGDVVLGLALGPIGLMVTLVMDVVDHLDEQDPPTGGLT